MSYLNRHTVSCRSKTQLLSWSDTHSSTTSDLGIWKCGLVILKFGRAVDRPVNSNAISMWRLQNLYNLSGVIPIERKHSVGKRVGTLIHTEY